MHTTAAIFSKPSQISLELAKSLIEKKVTVYVVSLDTDSWQKITDGFDGRCFKIVAKKEDLPQALQYIIIYGGLGFDISPTDIYNLSINTSSKVLFIFPHIATVNIMNQSARFTKYFDGKNMSYKSLYLGSLIGDGVSSRESLLMGIVKKVQDKNELIISDKNQELYILETNKASEHIIKFLFTFGVNKTALLGNKTNYFDLLKIISKVSPQSKTSHVQLFNDLQIIKPDLVINTDNDTELFIQRYLNTKPLLREINIKVKKNYPKKPNVKINIKQYVMPIFLVVLFLAIPFLLLLSSLASMAISYKLIVSGKNSSAMQTINVSKHLSRASMETSGFIGAVPILGSIYNESYSTANVVNKSSDLLARGLKLSEKIKILSKGIMGEDYDVETLVSEIYLELDDIYKEVSFLEDEIYQPTILNQIITARKYLYKVRETASGMHELLGFDEPATYLIMFQNNMELRPTGGFIGSFALVTFNNGKLIDTTVFDVYSADGQLKGFIAPPDPIRDHLGEPSWFLRDSNWDPDFIESAQKAEWFLDKSLDRKVNGVIGINLETAKMILKSTGPVELPDFDTEINENNIYEKVQFEVEKDFFPGSKKKANYLTALSQAILERLSNLDEDDYYDIGKGIFENLQSRDIQIFMHQDTVSEVLNSLNWDGAIDTSECIGNCVTSWLGVVEANVGVNKANYFINRNSSLRVEADSEKITNTLSLMFSNNSTSTTYDPKARYKNYIRVLAPSEAKFDEVEITTLENTKYVNPDIEKINGRSEAGALVTVNPSQTVLVKFKWSIPTNLTFNSKGKIEVKWRKQSGVAAHPIAIEILRPFVSLTTGNSIIYNTNFDHDIVTELNW